MADEFLHHTGNLTEKNTIEEEAKIKEKPTEVVNINQGDKGTVYNKSTIIIKNK